VSTDFKPLEIPPGVVATATKKMSSSNWSEVNCVRWSSGQLTPIGPQVQYNYQFASRCKAVHGWYGADKVYRTAYLCEAHLYVDVGGIMYDISPIPPIAPPGSISQGGYGDLAYNTGPPDSYGTPRAQDELITLDKPPPAYSLDNFGSILYAMTSTDGRLLKWDASVGTPPVTGSKATLAFTTSSPIIYVSAVPPGVVSGMTVTDASVPHVLGSVASAGPFTATSTAQYTFAATQSSILASPHPTGIGAGHPVTDTTTNKPLGTIATYGPFSQNLTALGGWTSGYFACFMPPAPAWVIPGLTLKDTTTGAMIGTLFDYKPYVITQITDPGTLPAAGNTTIVMDLPGNSHGWIIPGMNVTELVHLPGWSAKVVSYVGNTLVVDTPLPSSSSYLELRFDSGTQSMVMWTGSSTASSGATDTIQFHSGANEVITFTAPIGSASSGSIDALSIVGQKLTLAANSAFAGAVGADIQYGGNRCNVQIPDSGRGPVPTGRFFVVTPERFLVIFGSTNDGTAGGGGSSRRFAWCDQENPGAWDYTNVISMAGFLDIEPASPIHCGISTRTGILFFTGKKAYRSRFLGLPYIYNYEELADNCTPWSPQSMATTSSMVLWMSDQGLFSFDGTTILPVACNVQPWIDDDIDILTVRSEACAVHLSTFNEWWWFFPQKDQPYNTRAIAYSYKEGWFGQARMSRSAGVTASYNSHSIMADGLIAMQHETPYGQYINCDPPFVETFDLNLAGGGRLVTVKQLIPDIELVEDSGMTQDQINAAIAQLRYSLFYRNSRSIGTAEQQTDFKTVRPNGFVDFRTTGRDVRMRIDLPAGVLMPFTIGQHMIDITVRGDR
jgi:hypothetical protein